MAKPNSINDLWRRISDDPASGCWIWVGNVGKRGYGVFPYKGKNHYAHRFVYQFFVGDLTDDRELDHICHNTRCVNPDHLRTCTHSQNGKNLKLNKNNKSGFKGVFWRSDIRKWRASIAVDGRSIYLGLYSSPQEAHAAYCDAARKHFGEFACAGAEAA